MVKRSTLIWLLAALALVAGFVVVDQIQTKREATIAERSRLMMFEVEDVAKLQIEQKTDQQASTIEIERDPELEWKITQPVETKVELFTLNNLLDTAATLKPAVEVEVDATNPDLGQYGLNPAEALLTISLKDGTSQVLKIGIPDFDNTGVYVQAEDNRVATVPIMTKEALLPTLFKIRDKKLLELPRNDIESIEINHKGEAFKLVHQDSTWRILEPQEVPIDGTKLNSLLNPLLSLQASEVLEEDKAQADLSRYQLDKPTTQMILDLKDDKETVTLDIGRINSDNNAYYTLNSVSPLVASINSTIVDAFPLTLKDLRSKQIMPTVEISSIEKIQIEAKDPELSRVFTPKKASGDSTPSPSPEAGADPLSGRIEWSVSDQPERLIIMDSFFTALQSLSAVDFTKDDPSTQALTTPEFKVTLTPATSPDEPIVLEFAKATGKVYVRTSYQPDHLVLAEEALNDLQTVINSYKPLAVSTPTLEGSEPTAGASPPTGSAASSEPEAADSSATPESAESQNSQGS